MNMQRSQQKALLTQQPDVFGDALRRIGKTCVFYLKVFVIAVVFASLILFLFSGVKAGRIPLSVGVPVFAALVFGLLAVLVYKLLVVPAQGSTKTANARVVAAITFRSSRTKLDLDAPCHLTGEPISSCRCEECKSRRQKHAS